MPHLFLIINLNVLIANRKSFQFQGSFINCDTPHLWQLITYWASLTKEIEMLTK